MRITVGEMEARVREMEEKARARHLHGGDFVLDEDADIEAIWGDGASVLWPRGEGLMLAGGVGAGKSTILQQLIFHGIGILPGQFLGFSVDFPDGVVGYVAADRPRQIQRSMRRMVTEGDRVVLDARLDVWRGALPFDLATAPVGALADFAEERGWSVLAIDSLKDVTSGTTDDDVGLAVNRQFQEVLVRDVELVVNHHDRKASGDGRKRAKTLDDVYGSRWLTAGFGSVLYAEGQPGATDVTLHHFKQPMDTIGSVPLRHDHATGRTVVANGGPQVTVLRKPGQGPFDATDAVRSLGGKATAAQVASLLSVSERQAHNYLKTAVATGDMIEHPRRNSTDSITYEAKP